MRLLLAAAICATVPAAADAARLRGSTTLAGKDVTIADLWDDTGAEGPRVLGPAPGPGGHITVEAPQLAAIARQFGIAWRPASPADRATLDRPGRPLPREAVLAVLHDALAGLGAPDDADIALAAFAPPMLPLEAEARATVEQVEYDAATGRFTAILVMADAAPAMRQRLLGSVREMVELPTPTHRLPPGAAISAQDLRLTRLPAASLRAEPVRTLADAIGMAPRHAAAAGQPLARSEMMRPVAVEKGARVTMELEAPGLAVVTVGQAAESGGIGDRVPIINLSSRAVVEAEIVATGRVRVMPDTLPRLPGRGLDPLYANLPPASRVQ